MLKSENRFEFYTLLRPPLPNNPIRLSWPSGNPNETAHLEAYVEEVRPFWAVPEQWVAGHLHRGYLRTGGEGEPDIYRVTAVLRSATPIFISITNYGPFQTLPDPAPRSGATPPT